MSVPLTPRASPTRAPSAPSLETFGFAVTDTLSISLRAIMRDGDPWFNAADVCAALGLTNVSQAVQRLDDDEKAMLSIGLRGSAPWFVTESGLYALVLRSDRAEAKQFRKWITKDVLPTIRKQGAYVQGANRLSPEAQGALYGHIRAQLREAMRRHDRATEHDHYRSFSRQAEWSRQSSERVAREMGLPVDVVVMAAARGVDAAIQIVVNERGHHVGTVLKA